jgi:phosphatidylserine/phosphatidylglycerophosphate/cardiolipin synthase-like enzyme
MKRIYSWLFLISACILSLLVGYLVSPKEISFPVCSYSVSDNLVPIVNNNYFNTTFNEISNANKSIDLILYEFKWYDSNNVVVKLRQSLADAVKRNVSVRVILDQNQYRDVLTELSKENKKTGDYLKSKGVEVKYDSLTQTTHNKMIIIDNSIVILGSHNWGYSALTRNNEASVMIKDRGVAEYYNNYFEILWKNL